MKKTIKNKLYNILNLYLIIVILFSSLFVPKVFASEVDLEELVKGEGGELVIKAVSTDPVDRDGSIDLELSFSISESNIEEAKENDIWFYDLSEWLQKYPISGFENKEGTMMDGSANRGTYEIKDNKIYIKIDKNWVQTGHNISGNFTFSMNLSPDKVGTDNNFSMDLPGGESIDIKLKEIKSTASKKFSTKLEEYDTYISWTSSDLYLHKDDKNEFYLYYKDEFTCDTKLPLDEKAEFVYENNISKNQEVDLSSFVINGKTIEEDKIEYKDDEENKKVTINLKDVLGKDFNTTDKIEITYKVKVLEEDFGEEGWSKAKWGWTYSDENKEVSSDSNELKFKFYEYKKPVPLSKTMVFNEDKRYIDYTITVGDGEIDLAGGELNDEMTDLQDLDKDGEFIVKCQSHSNSTEEDTCENCKALKEYITKTWENDNNYDKSTKTPVFNLKFPEEGKFLGPYTITYRTYLTKPTPEISGNLYVGNYIEYIDKKESQRNSKNGCGENINFYCKYSKRFNKEFHKIDTENNLIYWRVPIYVCDDENLSNVELKETEFTYGISNEWGGITEDNTLTWEIMSNDIKTYYLKQDKMDEYFEKNKQSIEDQKEVSEEVIVEELLKKYDPDDIFEQKDVKLNYENNTITFPNLNSVVFVVIPIKYSKNIQETADTWMFNNTVDLTINSRKVGSASATYTYSNKEKKALLQKNVEFQNNGVYKWTVVINENQEKILPDYDPYFYDIIPDGMVLTNENGEIQENQEWDSEEGKLATFYYVPINISMKGTDKKGNHFGDYSVYEKILKSKSILNKIPRFNLKDGNWYNVESISGVAFTITYYTKFSDEEYNKRIKDPFNSSVKYVNKAYLYGSDNDSDLKAEVEKETSFDFVAISKKALTTTPLEDLVDYEITVNKDEISLNNGKNLVIKDKIADNVDIVLNSIKVEDKNGENLKGAKIGYNSKTKILQITIPDNICTKIKYQLKVMGSGNQTVINSVDLIGIKNWNDTISTDYMISKHAGVISADTNQINLHKIDEEDITIPMNNAVFELTNEEDKTSSSYVTNDSYLKFDYLKENELYSWKEITAPEGYQVDDTIYYFILCRNSKESSEAEKYREEAEKLKEKLEKEKGIEIAVLQSGYELTVSNKKIVSKPEEQVPEVQKPEESKPEEPKTEEPKLEEPKTESPKLETPKIEEAIIESPKEEVPQEQPKQEAPQVQDVEVQQEIVSKGIKTGDGVIIYFSINIVAVIILFVVIIKKKKNEI